MSIKTKPNNIEKVIVYAKSTCSYCKVIKDKFKEQQLNESEEDTEAITEEISDMPVEEIPQDLDMSGGLMSRRQ